MKSKNYNILGNYTYYLPGIGGMFALFGWLLLGSLIGSIITAVFVGIFGAASSDYALLVSYPVQFIPAMMYASAKSRQNSINCEGSHLDNNHFGKSGVLLCCLLVIAATLAAGFCTDAVSSLLPAMPEFLKQLMETMTQGTLWVNIVSVSVFAPFFEEWLCRGMVLRGLLGRGTKPVWAIVISAAFFAFIHFNPWQAVPAFILGCLFGYVYFKTGSLKLTMLMHCANNTFSVLLSRVDSLSEMESWMDVLPGYQYWVIFAACMLLLILIVRVFAAIPQESPKGNCDTVPSLFEQ